LRRENHALGSRPSKEALPRILGWGSPHLRQFLPENPLGLWHCLGHETGELLEVGAALTAILQMGMEINELRTLQQSARGKRTKRFVLLVFG
jgi:hypothetical protein